MPEFLQTPNCNYNITVEVKHDFAWLSLSQDTESFSIYTRDDLLQLHFKTIRFFA